MPKLINARSESKNDNMDEPIFMCEKSKLNNRYAIKKLKVISEN